MTGMRWYKTVCTFRAAMAAAREVGAKVVFPEFSRGVPL